MLAPTSFTTTSWLTSGRPRQFMVMCEKSRCSILFHLLVLGGKWHAVIASPVSVASRCSSTFHRRDRYPLLPPPAAQISKRSARGYRGDPIDRHHRRILSAAKVAVSWSVPTLTQPRSCPMSYTP